MIKVLTNKPIQNGWCKANGTRVTHNGEKIENVTSVELSALPEGVWELTIKIAVDPASLFEYKDS